MTQDTRRDGTIEGVFVPTLLTVLGVILFLRTDWVVGNAGLLGSIGIIGVACTITGFTALSLASISTNVTPGAGGAYALVARSYGAINAAVLAETTVDLPSYRPTFRVPWPIPLAGALGCLVASARRSGRRERSGDQQRHRGAGPRATRAPRRPRHSCTCSVGRARPTSTRCATAGSVSTRRASSSGTPGSRTRSREPRCVA